MVKGTVKFSHRPVIVIRPKSNGQGLTMNLTFWNLVWVLASNTFYSDISLHDKHMETAMNGSLWHWQAQWRQLWMLWSLPNREWTAELRFAIWTCKPLDLIWNSQWQWLNMQTTWLDMRLTVTMQWLSMQTTWRELTWDLHWQWLYFFLKKQALSI